MATVSESAGREHLRYSNVAVALHWTIVVLLLAQVWLGFTFADMPRGPERMEFFAWHKTIGALILLLTLARLGYRLKNPPPAYPPQMPAWRRIAAVWTHRLLYTLLIALPLTGLIAVSGHGGPATPLIGGIPLPTVPGINEATGEISEGIHELLVWSTIALLALHVCAALYEQFGARMGVAYRMLPFMPRDGRKATIGQGSKSEANA